MEYIFSPSELDYKPKKCSRCYYISKHFKIDPGDRPPPVFSSFDAAQKPYFKKINTKKWCDGLPDGEVMDEKELPGKIVSKDLEDNKNRKFQLRGIPDIVVKFKDKGFGIIDFKTTKISLDKAENYKYQLEAYAQIFANPGSTKSSETPKLDPITHMGILQFYPNDITDHTNHNCNFNMKTFYSPLKRNKEDFYNHVTKLIDLLEQPNIPEINEACNFCNFVKKQINLTETS